MENTALLIALQRLNITLNKTVGEDLRKHKLTPTEFSILAHLNAKGKTKTQKIGEIAFITSGAITYFINKFIKKGYVTRYQDKTDKRIIWIDLTEKGKTFYNDVFSVHKEYMNNLFSLLDNDDKQNLYQGLRNLNTKLIKRKKEIEDEIN